PPMLSHLPRPPPPPTPTPALSLHDALPISKGLQRSNLRAPLLHHACHGRQAHQHGNENEKYRQHQRNFIDAFRIFSVFRISRIRSEEHTSELQSRFDLVCRLLLEKKKKTNN